MKKKRKILTSEGGSAGKKVVLLTQNSFVPFFLHLSFHSSVSREARIILQHGNIIRTGATCKKINCYMRDSAWRWFTVKEVKIYEILLNIFEFSRV